MASPDKEIALGPLMPRWMWGRLAVVVNVAAGLTEDDVAARVEADDDAAFASAGRLDPGSWSFV